ncbi:uncharacterized protein LOC141652385 [Silene latifolia]|uniref:uncharacterized protein LOC141652385 n=1 Tax=Silene latifolia TaxID=37657 RepID=UPI003D779C58
MAKKKHVIRDSMKSFFDYHTDPVKHEQLQATRKDMEEKKNEILNIVQNEGDKEDLKSGPLTELIEVFHKQYESLYAHYDHLTGELKDKVHKHHHENKDSSSSSSESDSDSDSDHSPKEKGIRNRKLEDEISKTTDGLRQELEATKLEVALFKNQLELVCNEKKTLESAYDAIVSKLMSTERIAEELNSEKSNLLGTEIDLKQQIEELIRDKHNLDIENSSLKLELDTVTREKKEMEEQFESKVIELEKMVEEVPGLKTKISQVEILLKEREDQLSSLQHKLEIAQVDDSTQEADELPAEKTQLEELEGHLQEGRLDFEEAQRQIKKLKRDMEKARKEADVALEKTRTMEVQLRLANQKIHVTEQVLAEKEEDYKNAKNFQEECKLLEYKISRLLVALAANDKAYGGMITNITENVSNSIAGMEYFTKKFEEDNGKFSSRIYDISEEIRIMKQFLAGKNTEREKLEQQLRNLTEELEKEREYGLTVKEKLSKLKVEVEKEQVEKEKVVAALKEVKRSREELDALLTKKNEQVLILEDEKREAIRQLCLWSGNLQSRYDEVKNMVVKSRIQKR